MDGDPDGFVEFAAARGTQLFRMAYLLTGDRYAAEDLVQITLGKLYSSWAKARRAGNLVAYSRTVMIRSHLAGRRKTRLEQPGELCAEPVAHDSDTPLRLTLFAALAELDSRDRAIVVLRYWHDLSVEETAGLVGLSSVRGRQCRPGREAGHDLGPIQVRRPGGPVQPLAEPGLDRGADGLQRR